MKTVCQRDICTPTFTVALLAIIKVWNQLVCPSKDEWIQKITVCICVHAHNGILFSHNMIYSYCYNMDNP